MNKKGTYTSGVIFIIITICLLLTFIIYTPIMSSSVSIKSLSSTIDKNIAYNTKWARIYSIIYSNPSVDGVIEYEAGSSVEVNEIGSEVTEATLGPVSVNTNDTTSIPLSIISSTDVLISLTRSSPNSSIDVVNENNTVIYSRNLNNSTLIIIPKEYFYNKETGTTRYGDYLIKVYSKNKETSVKVEYTKLDTRAIQIEEGGVVKKIFLIQINNKSVKIKEVKN